MSDRSSSQPASKLSISDVAPTPVTAMEARLQAAVPRLRRTVSRVINVDVCDDVIQETMFEAWRGISNIHDIARFDAWLDGICHNVCLRYLRARYRQKQHEAPLLDDVADAGLANGDPGEELQHADLVVLLDRALGHLSAASRQVLELCYVDSLSPNETAMQLGLTRNALDVRLSRARRQLQSVLNGPLRGEARAFGIALDAEDDTGWRESREWCTWCGTRRMQGLFTERPGFGRVLRMRCPACSPRYGMDLLNTAGILTVDDVHSFRPVIKRMDHAVKALLPVYHNALRHDGVAPCACGRAVPIRICTRDDLGYPIPSVFWIALDCSQCGPNIMTASHLWMAHPTIQRFKETHPHYVHEPSHIVSFGNQAALQHTFRSLPDNACLTVIADARCGDILAIITDP